MEDSRYKLRSVWVSPYGAFEIPLGLEIATKWKRSKRGEVIGVLPEPENWQWFKWLHEQEVAAGKVEKGDWKIVDIS